MKKTILLLLTLSITAATYSQTEQKPSTLNLDFESTENGKPGNWKTFGSTNYILSLDSTTFRNGKYSAFIEFKEGNPNFAAWSFTIPDNYAGKTITLTGYIKTENVTEGYAGLWMRIDPNVAFDNMGKNGIKGTTDWKKYEITLHLNPDKTKQIVFGALLAAKGKMWVDDFSVKIDGKDLTTLKPYVRKEFPAERDKEFDRGSGIVEIAIDQNKIDNLNTLGLIWGFLKYYHPAIAKGKYNWDYELFRVLPEILNAENKEKRDNQLIKWINTLGPFTQSSKPNRIPSDAKIKPDLDWIENSNFSTDLKNLLLTVKNAERTNEHYYIGLYPGVGNPDIKNENDYSFMNYPDTGFRIVSLFRYWNIIQYYFPYKNLLDDDWKKVLPAFIPKFIQAKDQTEYSLAVLELIGLIHDTHANIWGRSTVLNSYFGQLYASVEVTFIEGKPLVTGFPDKKTGNETGLEIGDVITSVNSKPVEEIVKAKLKYYPASNYPTKLRDFSRSILRTTDSIITIEYKRRGNKQNKRLKTYYPSEINIGSKNLVNDTSFRLLNPKIAYINNGSLQSEHLQTIWKEIENTKGLIIDCRNYPSNFPGYELCNKLMPESKPFAKFTNGSLENPGLFTFTQPLNTGFKNKNYYKGKVIILVNEVSQSSSEFHAMMYKTHPKSIIIGSTTAGADGNVSQFFLPGGFSTMISGIGVYYPDGKETQRVGIIPDIEIKPTIKGIINKQDELLDKAIEIISKQ